MFCSTLKKFFGSTLLSAYPRGVSPVQSSTMQQSPAGRPFMSPQDRLHVKADVNADVEPIADAEIIQTKTETETKTETKSGEPARGARLRAPRRCLHPLRFRVRFRFFVVFI